MDILEFFSNIAQVEFRNKWISIKRGPCVESIYQIVFGASLVKFTLMTTCIQFSGYIFSKDNFLIYQTKSLHLLLGFSTTNTKSTYSDMFSIILINIIKWFLPGEYGMTVVLRGDEVKMIAILWRIMPRNMGVKNFL